MPPALPWEVIERVIGHSAHHRPTLRSFSLTCHDLRPYSLSILVADADLKNRDQIFDFCDFLRAKPHLKRFARSLTLNPNDFAPIPLLTLLPNLSALTLSCPQGHHRAVKSSSLVILNRSSIICCQLSGVQIHTLHLSALRFAAFPEFARALLAFTSITHLTCTDVLIEDEDNGTPLDVIKRRLSLRLRLKTLTIGRAIHSSEAAYDLRSVAGLLLDSGLAHPTIENVTVEVPIVQGISQLSGFPRLQSLVLRASLDSAIITRTTALLRDLHHPTLKDVIVELHSTERITAALSYADELYEGLEQILLGFSRSQIVWIIGNLRAGRKSFWTQELGKRFPALFQRNSLTVAPSETGHPVHPTGHESGVRILLAAPNSQWIASASWDGTIILWDATSGEVAQQWAAHTGKLPGVLCLAFSPDNLYIVSGGNDGKAVVWGLDNDQQCQVTMLEGHTLAVTHCAWSPRGDTIVSGSDDKTGRLWDSRTFQQLHVLETAQRVQRVAFSPDGRWLVSVGAPHDHRVWDVASGALHRSLPPDNVFFSHTSSSAAFDPASTRLATVSYPSQAAIWDLETGRKLLNLGNVGKTRDIVFSPDGKMVLSTSSGDDTVRIWHVGMNAEPYLLEGHKGIVSQARFSPCGTYIASASEDNTVRLWRTGDGSSIATFSDLQHSVYHLAFSPDGKTLSCGGSDGTVIIRRMCDIIPAGESDQSA